MEIVFKSKAQRDKEHWKTSGNKQVLVKIEALIKDILQHPETGIGKPEQLKHELTGMWSRHINEKHRIIYEIVNDELHILSLKGHYYDK